MMYFVIHFAVVACVRLLVALLRWGVVEIIQNDD